MLYTVEQAGFTPNQLESDTLKARVKAKLEAQGFEVTLFDPAAGLNGKQLLASTPVKEFVINLMLLCYSLCCWILSK